jgi:hypothetical protein
MPSMVGPLSWRRGRHTTRLKSYVAEAESVMCGWLAVLLASATEARRTERNCAAVWLCARCDDLTRSFFAGTLAFRATWREGDAEFLARREVPPRGAEQKDAATIERLPRGGI